MSAAAILIAGIFSLLVLGGVLLAGFPAAALTQRFAELHKNASLKIVRKTVQAAVLCLFLCVYLLILVDWYVHIWLHALR
jgi:hypothetical protein